MNPGSTEKITDNDKNVPEVFTSRKRKILAELSIPDAEYTDLSPKGSVDEGIRYLIDDINTLPGLVTTSSCAGRISVFLEGRRQQQQQQQRQRQFVPSGGKGAGKWLYVSHDPLNWPCSEEANSQGRGLPVKSLHDLFGMVPGDGKPPRLTCNINGQAPRLVRFHFEPMILHIMTATLQHAQPVLAAASSSGFRESGLQSLRCLEGNDGPSPIVAVRSAGLSLESIIGYCDDNDSGQENGEPVVRSLVTEEYLEMLVAISNERFSINAERKERFRSTLLQSLASTTRGKAKAKPAGWEDPDVRRQRKRAEGLWKKKQLESQTAAEKTEEMDDPSGLPPNY